MGPVCHTQEDDNTALILAAAGGHTDCVRLLLKAGADIEAKNNVRYMHFVSN